MAQYSSYILVCGGTGCRASQSELILQNLKEAVERQGLQETVQVIRTGCFGFCEKGPVVKMVPYLVANGSGHRRFAGHCPGAFGERTQGGTASLRQSRNKGAGAGL